MAAVKSIIRCAMQAKQPRGGYLNPSLFRTFFIDDALVLNPRENLNPTLVQAAVNYLTRLRIGTPAQKTFTLALEGARIFDETYPDTSLFKTRSAIKHAKKLMTGINGLDADSIVNTCKLAGYDVCARASIAGYKPIDTINPDAETVRNIELMTRRTIEHFRTIGPVRDTEVNLLGAYTDAINCGNAEYITKNTLWSVRVSKNELSNKHTLQLLLQYIMGCSARPDLFQDITYIGMYNPRLNKAYFIPVQDIPSATIKAAAAEVIHATGIEAISFKQSVQGPVLNF